MQPSPQVRQTIKFQTSEHLNMEPRENTYEKRVTAFNATVTEGTQNGILEGVASQVGVMDAYRSVVLPGAWDRCLRSFLKSGHVCFNHNGDKWIGMPTSAKMEGRNLKVSAEFYDDEFSQEVRRKLSQRQDANRETDFSVAFRPDWQKVEYFDSGEKLWTYCLGLGTDMSLMDSGIKNYRGYCWIIPEILDLAEWGPVTSGATPGAGATGVRSINDLRDGSLAETSLENHLECALAAVQGALDRFGDYANTRSEGGRSVSRDRLSQVEALASSLMELASSCRSALPGSDHKLLLEIDLALAGL